VLFLATGGTVALDSAGVAGPVHLPAARLLAAVPNLAGVATPVVAEAECRRSSHVSPADMREIAATIHARPSGCSGVVVAHGTDTLEETAYALALMLQPDLPVVLTGAMRRPADIGADGPANLLAAFRVAAFEGVRAAGPVVVFADEIHAARDVTKVHTTAVAAFASPGAGPIGRLTEGRVELLRTPADTDRLGLPQQLVGRVELVWAAAGSDGRLIDAASEIADGIVVAAMGGGHLPPGMAAAAARAARRVPVVLTSRCASGSLLRATYEGTGSEQELRAAGLLDGGGLAPVKARLRLLVALALDIPPSVAFPT
jgi:L-asparaginase